MILGAVLRCMVGLLRSRASLVAEDELLRQQLAVAKCRLRGKRVRWSASQRWLIGLIAGATARAGYFLRPHVRPPFGSHDAVH